jgi:hypothetical protein
MSNEKRCMDPKNTGIKMLNTTTMGWKGYYSGCLELKKLLF